MDPTPLPVPSFPMKISNTQRSSFVICPQQWYWRYCLGIRPPGRSIHLDAGASFATGLEAARNAFYLEGRSPAEAVEHGYAALEAAYPSDMDDRQAGAKSLNGMLGALRYYFDSWPLERDYFTPKRFGEQTGVEFTFAIPLPINHPDTGDPLLLDGRIDMIAEYKRDGIIWVLDDKTTSALGSSWRRQWELDSQITTYVWAAQQFGYPAAGAIIRGLGILKTMYKSEEVIVPRDAAFIDRWLKQLLDDIQRMIDIYRSERAAPRALDKAICGMYGGCGYVRACASADPSPWLASILQPLPANQMEIPAELASLLE